MKKIYLIRHSGPFVKLKDEENMEWKIRNKNMILSSKGEENAKKLIYVKELKNIDEIYSSNSARAIATVKYIAEENNLAVKIENRINERVIGVENIRDIPKEYIKRQFENKEYKLEDGESIDEVRERFTQVINEIINNSNLKKIILSVHCVALMAYFSTFSKVEYDNSKFKVIFKDKVVMNGYVGNPDVYELTIDDNGKIVDLKNIYSNQINLD